LDAAVSSIRRSGDAMALEAQRGALLGRLLQTAWTLLTDRGDVCWQGDEIMDRGVFCSSALGVGSVADESSRLSSDAIYDARVMNASKLKARGERKFHAQSPNLAPNHNVIQVRR
jgi:hypothetical protein